MTHNLFADIATSVKINFLSFLAGLTADAYKVAREWVGHLPGGLGIATVLANAAFGAAAGSSPASCAAFSQIAVPEMARSGYSMLLALLLRKLNWPTFKDSVFSTLNASSMIFLLLAGASVFSTFLTRSGLCADHTGGAGNTHRLSRTGHLAAGENDLRSLKNRPTKTKPGGEAL